MLCGCRQVQARTAGFRAAFAGVGPPSAPSSAPHSPTTPSSATARLRPFPTSFACCPDDIALGRPNNASSVPSLPAALLSAAKGGQGENLEARPSQAWGRAERLLARLCGSPGQVDPALAGRWAAEGIPPAPPPSSFAARLMRWIHGMDCQQRRSNPLLGPRSGTRRPSLSHCLAQSFTALAVAQRLAPSGNL